MNPDTILWVMGLSAEIVVLLLCVRTKLFRITPIFCCYLAWCLLNDVLFFFLSRRFSHTDQWFHIYVLETALDSVFQFAVLVELGWAVLRPVRASLPRHSLLILTILLGIGAAMIWPIAAHMLPGGTSAKSSILFFRMQQTVAVLRVVIFLAMAGFSQLLSIGWRNRELQIATGLGFYSMCNLAIWVIHSHQTLAASGGAAANRSYHLLDQIAVVSYLCSLAYWIYCFSHQEQDRQEFTPQMRSFLLTVTGGARSSRVALADSALGTTRKSGRP